MFTLFAGISTFSKSDEELIVTHNDAALLSPESKQNGISLNNDFNENTEIPITSVNEAKGHNKVDKCTIFLMSMIVITGPLSTESQVPALQNIQTDFHTTSQLVQLSITI